MTDRLAPLHSDDADARNDAIRDLAREASPELLDELQKLLSDPAASHYARQAAAETLGQIGPPDGAAILYGLLEDDDATHRELAAIGLGRAPSAETVQRLIAALSDKVNTVRNVAERSLLAMEEELAAHGVEPLLELLEHPVPLSRSPAARLLGITQDERALEPLLNHLQNDRQWLARMWAAKGLGDLGKIEAAQPLAHAMQHDEKNRVRAASAEALGKLRPDNAEQLLRTALETDDDGGVRKIAGEALYSLGFESPEYHPDDPFDE
ncbi:HEAT repeat protein [Maioricimonas rarisocia]|uniref:HEAT repeat protein n=1 Tax=Maioricimonas rarisocia TaxID=2528026 RepID=A0A517Z114_9PLAN|nr:HEAT repeat domain-containing protein [Maioricimonas rarisocia]QDU36170.1 HEAT repeat protein [Maioricimonas rarisocia]